MGLPFLFGIVALAFAVSFLGTKLLIHSAWRKGLLASDDNKKGKPKVPNFGGFALFAGFCISILAAVLYSFFIDKTFALSTLLLASLSSVALVALIGVFDDLFRISRWLKIFLPVVGALPLIVITAGDTVMSLPFIGVVDFGLFYTFFLIPLGVTGAANAINMSAGYNGLETGQGVVISLFLLLIAFLAIGVDPSNISLHASTFILASLFGACLGFLYFNRYPSKVFPGDIGTLVIGAAIANAVIIGNMEKFGFLLFIPAFYELGATLYYFGRGDERRRACHSPVIASDGKLSPPKGAEKFTLFYRILSAKPLKEKTLVLFVLSLYALFGVVALALYFFGL
ncbi:MAG: hypothetical protein V1834_00880 [Candidatus Micrarchaeota archaeon]